MVYIVNIVDSMFIKDHLIISKNISINQGGENNVYIG